MLEEREATWIDKTDGNLRGIDSGDIQRNIFYYQ